MTIYTYTEDFPNEDIDLSLRLGYRVPREILLPPYIYQDYFRGFTDAIDAVFEETVDMKTEILGNLRNMWVSNVALENSLYDNPSQLIPFSSWSQPERAILVKQVNMLGMKLQSAGIITDDGYQAIARWLGMYWWGKGTESFINFINYSLSANLTVNVLWTSDYVNFLPAGDPGIGTPLWEGGDWYPTTTVEIIAQGGFAALDIPTLVNFFYEIANYNLVLQAITIVENLWITSDPKLVHKYARVVAVGLWIDESIVISNFAQYGANPPPVYSTAPQITASAYVPSQTIGSGTFLLAQPTAWIEQNGMIFPVYGEADQAIKNSPNLPTSLMGGPSTNGQTSGYSLLYGPVTWLDVPGSSYSTARIPGYATTPVVKTQSLSEIPTQSVGAFTANLLTNPAGWADLAGTGYLTPYWLPNP
jgi:hypothetical protein